MASIFGIWELYVSINRERLMQKCVEIGKSLIGTVALLLVTIISGIIMALLIKRKIFEKSATIDKPMTSITSIETWQTTIMSDTNK